MSPYAARSFSITRYAHYALQVTFSPWLIGRRCPSPSSSSTAGLLGLSSAATQNDVARAVLEGVAFGMRACFEATGGNLVGDGSWGDATNSNALSIVGGGARSEIMCQIMAGVFGRPLRVGPTEAVGVVGAAMAGFSAIGLDKIMVQSAQPGFHSELCVMSGAEEELYNNFYTLWRRKSLDE